MHCWHHRAHAEGLECWSSGWYLGSTEIAWRPAKCSMIGPVQQEGQGEPCVNRLSHAPPLVLRRDNYLLWLVVGQFVCIL